MLRDGNGVEGHSYFRGSTSARGSGGREAAMSSANELADRYVELWNEPGPERRRAIIAELWTEAGVGLEFLVLAPDGRIRWDYQFVES
jgi:hypothetical protein